MVDEVYEKIADVLKSADIAYVKWDMNRQLTTMGSCGLPADRQGELYHRYVLGVYKMQERLLQDFPELLLENCSGGGARFDAGMLYYRYGVLMIQMQWKGWQFRREQRWYILFQQ